MNVYIVTVRGWGPYYSDEKARANRREYFGDVDFCILGCEIPDALIVLPKICHEKGFGEYEIMRISLTHKVDKPKERMV